MGKRPDWWKFKCKEKSTEEKVRVCLFKMFHKHTLAFYSREQALEYGVRSCAPHELFRVKYSIISGYFYVKFFFGILNLCCAPPPNQNTKKHNKQCH